MQQSVWPANADTLTFHWEIDKIFIEAGSCNTLFEATNDHNRVGGLIFGIESDVPMFGR